MRYATGKDAWGMCDRGGHRVKLNELVPDGQSPSLRVCRGCRDEKHPQEKPIVADDAVALKNARPDNDDDSVGDTGQTLAEAMGFTNTFGGET